MTKISITGYSGFIGQNIIKSKLFNKYNFEKVNLRINQKLNNNSYCLIHLAGIAHDISNKYSHEDYININYNLTKKVFNQFLASNANVFIFLSSSKAVKDNYNSIITESTNPNPKTPYGISKLKAENYILNKFKKYKNKRIFILRPSMIHGEGNKGNLNLLFNFIKKGLPWPLGSFKNKRSYLSIENLNFIINELIINNKISSGVYNISDNGTISTNEIIKLIKEETKGKNLILPIPKIIIYIIFSFLDIFKIKYNLNMLNKLTKNFIVDNNKIIKVMNKKLPLDIKSGLIKTLKTFNH